MSRQLHRLVRLDAIGNRGEGVAGRDGMIFAFVLVFEVRDKSDWWLYYEPKVNKTHLYCDHCDVVRATLLW